MCLKITKFNIAVAFSKDHAINKLSNPRRSWNQIITIYFTIQLTCLWITFWNVIAFGRVMIALTYKDKNYQLWNDEIKHTPSVPMPFPALFALEPSIPSSYIKWNVSWAVSVILKSLHPFVIFAIRKGNNWYNRKLFITYKHDLCSTEPHFIM